MNTKKSLLLLFTGATFVVLPATFLKVDYLPARYQHMAFLGEFFTLIGIFICVIAIYAFVRSIIFK
jgi:hypothetical protein